MTAIDLGASHILSLMHMLQVDDPEMGPALEMELRPEVVNPHGSLHGGLMGALIECGAAGCAVRASGSVNIVASDMNIRFLSTVKVGPARVVSEASVIDVGDDRKLVASSTLSYALLDGQ